LGDINNALNIALPLMREHNRKLERNI